MSAPDELAAKYADELKNATDDRSVSVARIVAELNASAQPLTGEPLTPDEKNQIIDLIQKRIEEFRPAPRQVFRAESSAELIQLIKMLRAGVAAAASKNESG